jgi:uncharacterized protein YjlB
MTFETYCFAGDGRFPNSPLPLLVYRRALDPSADIMERHFAKHGWTNAWRDGIYRFHHFHSIAHEVLGIAAGEAQVMFGGPAGRILAVSAGDIVVIPAGVAHCNHHQSRDFLVVGAYPDGGGWDVKRGDPHEYESCRHAIGAVALPRRNPVTGAPIECWAI